MHVSVFVKQSLERTRLCSGDTFELGTELKS
jgi:hypothetical protein